MTRPRKPLNLHVSEGTYRPDRHGPMIVSDSQGRPTKPPDLTPEAARFWDDVCQDLIGQGIAKRIDAPAMALMAGLWAKLQVSSRLADADPTDANARRAVTTYANEFCKLAARFGLTPADRLRLQATLADPAAKEAEIEGRYFGGD